MNSTDQLPAGYEEMSPGADDQLPAGYEEMSPGNTAAPAWSASKVNPVSDDQLQDLYANAKEVGYTGLDKDQQALFNQQFPYSQAAQHGMSLADAIKATDADASVIGKVTNIVKDIPSDVYGAARDVISAPVAGLAGVGSFLKNTAGDMIDGTPVDIGKNWVDAARYANDVRNEAMAGQGLPGMVADPINYVPLGDAATAARALTDVGLERVAKPLMSSWVPRALTGGVIGAGRNAVLTTTDNALSPDRDESMKSSIIGGGSMGAISGAMPVSHFVSELPGITTLTNRAGTPADKQRILDAATDMYNKSTLLGLPLLGGGKGSYQRVANKSLDKSTDLYKDLEKNVLEPGELPGEVRNATNVSGVPVTSNPVTIMNSRQYTVTPLSTADMKEGMLESLDNQNRKDKAGFTKDQLSKAVDSYLDRVSAVMPESDPRDFIRADQYVPPQNIFDSKTWLNNDIYNARQEPGAGQKAKLADMLHTAVNERIGKMTDAAGQTQKDLSSAAGKAYSDYKLKQRIVDQGIKSASGRYGNSFWAPTTLGKSISLGTQLGASLSR